MILLRRKAFVLKLLCTSLILFTSACSTINFVQYDQASQQAPENYWHHTLINGTVELSKPLYLKKICHGKAWTKLTTERSVWNILIGLPIPSYYLVVPYIAWTNRVYCFQVTGTEVRLE